MVREEGKDRPSNSVRGRKVFVFCGFAGLRGFLLAPYATRTRKMGQLVIRFLHYLYRRRAEKTLRNPQTRKPTFYPD